MRHYVHTGIVKLIMKGLQRLVPFVAWQAYDDIWRLLDQYPEIFPAEKKTELLDRILAAEGVDIVLKLGACCKEEAPFPLLYVLLNSSSPGTLIEKLEQYYQYFHSAKRLQLDSQGNNWLSVRHVSYLPQPVSVAEDFFACGMLLTLLELVGCRRVSYKWEALGDSRIYLYLDRHSVQKIPRNSGSQWRFQWETLQPSRQMHGLDDFILRTAKPLSFFKSHAIFDLVDAVVSKDLSRKWYVSDVARTLCMSSRTLQRRLREEGCSFAKLLSESRLKSAIRLLTETDTSLTEIGFVVGFSDYAHFSREFKKAQGISPLSYRKNMMKTQNPFGLFLTRKDEKICGSIGPGPSDHVLDLLPVGAPDESPQTRPRKPLDEITRIAG